MSSYGPSYSSTPQPIEDGTIDFSGGQDASSSPDKIEDRCIAAGINISVQNRIITPRPGFAQLDFIMPDGGVLDSKRKLFTYSQIFKSGRFQALIPYSLGSDFYVIAVISGIIYLINQRTLEVSVIEIADGSHINENLPRVKWSAAGEFLVIFDFPAYPVIIQGDFASRANPLNYEIPVSVLGAYNQNRLFIGNNGNAFTGGDPVGNLATPDAPITFEEVLAPAAAYLAQVFSVNSSFANSPITAMAFLDVNDTSTGIGPLLVATNREIFAYQTQNPRATWQAGAFGSAFITNAGIAGSRAFTNVNSDLFFISADGQVRSASMSRDEQKRWSKVPLSREVKNWLKYYDKSLIPYSFVSYFDNRIMIAANPYRVPSIGMFGNVITDVAFGGMVVIETANLAKLGQSAPPVWAGLWTGVRPMDICVNDERCFIASKDESNINHIYEITPDVNHDVDHGKYRAIRSVVYTKMYDFNNPFQDKQLHSADLAMQEVEGDFKVTLEYRPSHASKFTSWKSFTHKAPTLFCNLPDSCELTGLLGHSFKNLTFGAPLDLDACDPVTRELYRAFRKIQLKVIIEGRYWELHELKIRGTVIPINYLENVCQNYGAVEVCADCNTDWDIPEVNLCQTATTL